MHTSKAFEETANADSTFRILESQPTVASVPLVAFKVRFVDQNGNEIQGLPYEVSVRGVVNFAEAFQKQKVEQNQETSRRAQC